MNQRNAGKKELEEDRRGSVTHLDYDRLEVLFSDGEPGIDEALLKEGDAVPKMHLAWEKGLLISSLP